MEFFSGLPLDFLADLRVLMFTDADLFGISSLSIICEKFRDCLSDAQLEAETDKRRALADEDAEERYVFSCEQGVLRVRLSDCLLFFFSQGLLGMLSDARRGWHPVNV
jgi:hypothetical protein